MLEAEALHEPEDRAPQFVRFLFVVGEATDEPAREDARPTNGSNARPMLEVEASD